MRTVILVPRRAGVEDRDKLWAWCRARWERYHPDYPIFEGHHDEGPFNRAAAVNTAARLADAAGRWDLAIVIDADVFLRQSQVVAAVERARSTGKVTWAHTRWRGISHEWTKRIVADRRDFGPEITDRTDMDVLVERTNPISWSCCIVFPRAVWDDIGGFDERFVGWGYEDMAVQSIVAGLYGHERMPGDVYHLWHERPFGAGRADKRHAQYTAEAVTNARLGRRYMVALRRDHALHDRPDLPTSEAERARDIANLMADDAVLAAHVARLKLPDWSDWWPTLEELREQARAFNEAQRTGTVTVVVTSGGTEETWPERSRYLRESLASLAEHVTGPIVQRVIYSDWPEGLQPAVEAIAADYGFYVVGGQHVGYTEMRQRLWRYLAKRAQGTYVFATEDDFLFTRPVDLEPMIQTLIAQPNIVQVALLRDACYEDERQTGGILGWPEPAFTWRESWVEHRLFFTANSSLFRRSLTDVPWPTGRHSETLFGQQVLNDPKARSAFWGDAREPWIKHLGEVRAGSGY
jgi:hypothetical protein